MPVASLAIFAITSAGPTRYPTRIPGHTVLENEEAYTTSPSVDSSSIVGCRSPEKRSSTYGSSSKMVKSYSRASATSARRLSPEREYPAGFWKFGIRCASEIFVPAASRSASACTSTPSSASGTARRSAFRPFSEPSVRS